MPKYDYNTLNDKEFEELVCELLNEEFSLDLQSFKKGKDKGIDLRYSNPGRSNAIVVQAKHYNTNFKSLFRNLKSEELKKVRLLNPKAYWVATSLQLSAVEKDQIQALFDGFMPDANHVISGNDLSRLLTKHKIIAKNWLKLWLTNTNMLQRVISNALHGRSEFYGEKIVSRIKFYVKNKSLYEAGQMLRKNKFLLISGQPGVGKTTLADILTYEFLALKFQLLYIDKDIEEAGQVFEKDKDIPQIIYFDDFLGANHLEIMSLRSSESAIVRFIDRVQNSKNKYMILTTRTTILKDARENYEKLNRANIDLNKKELKLEDYSLEDKGKILYNHLYYSPISGDFKKEIFENKNYWKVIRHENYIPRLIEFFTTPFNLVGLDSGEYLEFMLNNLNNPSEVWRHSFTRQLHAEDRFLVSSLYSFGNYFTYVSYDFSYDIPLQCLHKAFDRRINHEIKINGFSRPNDAFNTSIRRLLDGYITSSISKASTEPKIKFLNPSIVDFLTFYFKESYEESWKVIYGALYIEQLKVCFKKLIDFRALKYHAYLEEANKFIDFVWDNRADFLPTIHLNKRQEISYENAFNCEMASLLREVRLYEEINERIEKLTANLFVNINFASLNHDAFENLIPIIGDADPERELYQYVNDHWERVMAGLWNMAGNDEDFEKIEELFDYYAKDLFSFTRNPDHKRIIRERLKIYINDKNFSDIITESDNIINEEQLKEFKDRIREEREELFDRYYMTDPGYDEDSYFDNVDIKENRRAMRKKKGSPVALVTADLKGGESNSEEIMVSRIDDLFTIDLKNSAIFKNQ